MFVPEQLINVQIYFLDFSDQDCSVVSCSTTQIQCTLSPNNAGNKSVDVHVSGLGYAQTNGVTFKYLLGLDSVTPAEGNIDIILKCSKLYSLT